MLNGRDEENVDINSIAGQLVMATQNHRIYRLLEWCSEQKISCLKNPAIARFIYEGHLNTQTVYIRGLYSPDSRPKDVDVSFNKIIKILEENKDLFIRSNFVKSSKSGPDIDRKNKRFDSLSAKGQENRNDNDVISKDFIDKLSCELKSALGKWKEFANTYITHKRNNEGVESFLNSFPDFKFGFKEIKKAHEILWKCFHVLNFYLFDRESSPRILSMYSQGYVDQALIDSVENFKMKLKDLEDEDSKSLKMNRFIDFKLS